MNLFNNSSYFRLMILRLELFLFLKTGKIELIFSEKLKEFEILLEKGDFLLKFSNFSEFKTLKPLKNLNEDPYNKSIFKDIQSFEILNLTLEKNIFILINEIFELSNEKPIESIEKDLLIDKIELHLKNVLAIHQVILEDFLEIFKELHAFPKNTRLKSIRYYKKTLLIIINLININENLHGIIVKSSKKAEENQKKRLISISKNLINSFREIQEQSIKILNSISGFFAKISDFSNNGTMQSLISDLMEKNENFSKKIEKIERTQHAKQLVISLISNDYKLLANSIGNDVKEELKIVKNLKI